jgi:hypothetical protein
LRSPEREADGAVPPDGAFPPDEVFPPAAALLPDGAVLPEVAPVAGFVPGPMRFDITRTRAGSTEVV